MSYDAFNTRVMIRAMEQVKSPRTFLKNTFFAETNLYDKDNIDIDIHDTKRRVATHISEDIGSVDVSRDGYNTQTYKPALVSLERSILPSDLHTRAMGESIYGSSSVNDREANLIARTLSELDEMITRKEELMCRQALFEGGVTISGAGLVTTKIPYDVPNETLTGANLWNTATAKIIDDLIRFRREILKNSGMDGNVVVLGAGVYSSFLNNTVIQTLLDKKRLDIGQISPEYRFAGGITFIGTIQGLDLWAYDEFYFDGTNEVPIVPNDKVLVGSRQARTEMAYGMIYDADIGSYSLSRVVKSWSEPRNGSKIIQVKAKPLPVIHQPKAFYLAKVI